MGNAMTIHAQPRGPHPVGRGAEHMWTPMDLQARAPIWGCPRELCVSALHARQTRVSGAHRPACLAGGVNDLDARAKSALRRASLRRRLTLLAASDVSAPSALCLASRRGGSSRSASCAAGCSARTSVEPRARLGLCRCRPVPCSLAPPCPCAASAGVASALEPSSRPWLRFPGPRLASCAAGCSRRTCASQDPRFASYAAGCSRRTCESGARGDAWGGGARTSEWRGCRHCVELG